MVHNKTAYVYSNPSLLRGDSDQMTRWINSHHGATVMFYEDGTPEVRPGYSLEYCGQTAVDLHGVMLQAALHAAQSEEG